MERKAGWWVVRAEEKENHWLRRGKSERSFFTANVAYYCIFADYVKASSNLPLTFTVENRKNVVI